MNKNFPCIWEGSKPITKYRTFDKTHVPSWAWRPFVAKALHTANVLCVQPGTFVHEEAH